VPRTTWRPQDRLIRCYLRAGLLTWIARLPRNALAGLAVGAAVGAVVVPMASAGSHHHRPSRGSGRAVIQFPGTRQVAALTRAHRVAIGVAPGYPISKSLPGFDRLVGRQARMVGLYQTWAEPLFYPWQLREIARDGAFPLIAWKSMISSGPVPLARIVAGDQDGRIRAAARSAAAWKHIIFVRLDPEMNLPMSAAGTGHLGNTAPEFVRAWRHVVRIFRQAHATNVKWVWSPNTDCGGKCPFTDFYPGNAWVDWVALDGYNFATVDHIRWFSFSRIFYGSYRILTHLTHKPMMIAETATADTPGSKAEWILGMGQALAHRLNRIRAVVWFERVKETNWSVNSSPGSLAAFRRVVRSYPFSQW
jgi:mannan endo-1,4-beta-mannosidase